jgi:hypothetical protein
LGLVLWWELTKALEAIITNDEQQEQQHQPVATPTGTV